jgi:hypothetical protein
MGSVVDPNPEDPYVLGIPDSSLFERILPSTSKKVRKTLISTILRLISDFYL